MAKPFGGPWDLLIGKLGRPQPSGSSHSSGRSGRGGAAQASAAGASSGGTHR